MVELKLALMGGSGQPSKSVWMTLRTNGHYQRNAENGWLMGRLEPGETLTVECEGYLARLRFEDIFEDVRWPVG